ncbi:MAG: glycosyltransferase [Selenomonadaceae bacterium]|nr:glycosyltransferase [Selenomonadaceae bacterium]
MVSVLINNHNYGEYIGEAIKSVLAQSFEDYELIIVDGDSTDESRKIVMSFVEQYPQKITAVFKPTSGQAAAFNVGYKLSKGDIIALLDADDFFLENKLEAIVTLHEQYDFVGHGRKFHDSDGKLQEFVVVMDDFDIRQELLRKYGYIYTYNLITSCISMKRSLADKIFPMPEQGYMTFADCYVKVLAQYYTNIKYIDEPLTYYRIHKRQHTEQFGSAEKIELFCSELYNRVFEDINKKLREERKEEIPKLTEYNLGEALKLANPNIRINKGMPLAIYGTGVYSEKVFKYVNAMGGCFSLAIDSNPNKFGMKWKKQEIVSLEQALRRRSEYDYIIIGTNNYRKEVIEVLLNAGLKEIKDFRYFVSIPND